MRLLGWLGINIRDNYTPQVPTAQDWSCHRVYPDQQARRKTKFLHSWLNHFYQLSWHSSGPVSITALLWKLLLQAPTLKYHFGQLLPTSSSPRGGDSVCSLGAALKGPAPGVGLDSGRDCTGGPSQTPICIRSQFTFAVHLHRLPHLPACL